MNFFCVLTILCTSLLLKSGMQGNKNCANYANIQIPVLCSHNIKPLNKRISPDYSISEERFYEHIKMLSDSGYTAILPDRLYEFLTTEKTLPAKSVMITFDNSHEEHFTTAATVREHFGFRCVFLIMTLTIGKHSYLTAEELKALSDRGHVIADHSWDHPNLINSNEKEWDQ